MEINQLMGSISQTTVSQANTSHDVTNLIQKLADLSKTTSQSSMQVAKSISETAQVAQTLESTVSQFKVTESVNNNWWYPRNWKFSDLRSSPKQKGKNPRE